jgi:hypothetical protein
MNATARIDGRQRSEKGMTMGESNRNYFLKNRARLLRSHRGKYAVIFEGALHGVYGSAQEAFVDSLKRGLAPGSFIIQHCVPQRRSSIRTFRRYAGVSMP